MSFKDDITPGRARRPKKHRLRAALAAALFAGGLGGLVLAAPQPFRQYLAIEYHDLYLHSPLPRDHDRPAEWVFARLMYPPHYLSRYGDWGWDWTQGYAAWTIDYPKGDRHIAEMVGRLTAIDARTVEQPVNLDDGDDVFYWPWLYAVEVGSWALTNEQAEKLREYLLRGGFLMVDDFHGPEDWEIFMESMKRVFPDRPIQDVLPEDPIFHVLYDVDDLSQIPGAQFLQTGRTWEYGGLTPHWRAIYDDDGRIMVMICHNMDLGDAVEHSDNPQYPENYSARAMRAFINFVVYSMTH